MAYDPNNPPSLIASGIGGSRGLKAWAWKSPAPIAEVLGVGYIRTARKLGMQVGDSVLYVDIDNDPHHLTVAAIDPDTGWGTVAFPNTAEEAYPVDAAPTGMVYVLAYVDGEQVRIPTDSLPPVPPMFASQAEAEAGTEATKSMNALRTKQAIDAQRPYASQAEAEAGTENTKLITALRLFQGIAAYITGRAAKTTPVDADALLITDSAAAGAPKRMTWLNTLNAIWTRLGGLIAGGTSKATPVDADSIPLSDSAASNGTKKLLISNLKSAQFGASGPTALNYMRRNAANTDNESRTPAQVAADIRAVVNNADQNAQALSAADKAFLLKNTLQAWEQIGDKITVTVAAATIDWTGLSAFRALRLKGVFVPTTTNSTLQMRVGAGSPDAGANYSYTNFFGVGSSASAGSISGQAQGNVSLSGTSADSATWPVVDVDINEFNKARATRWLSRFTAGDFAAGFVGGRNTAAVACDVLQIRTDAGNIGVDSFFVLEGVRG